VKLRVGDRIRLAEPMRDDPWPIAAGAEGTVTGTSELHLGDDIFEQVEVAWHDGRSLGLTCPPDRYEVVQLCCSFPGAVSYDEIVVDGELVEIVYYDVDGQPVGRVYVEAGDQ
jgi:hypothetical protein